VDSLNKAKTTDVELLPHHACYGYLIVDQDGNIMACNRIALELVRLRTDETLKPERLTKENLNDLVGPSFKETLLGSCIANKKSLDGQYEIGDQLYDVKIDRIQDDAKVWYEAFYFPVIDDESLDVKIDTSYQEFAYEIAKDNGYSDVEWIRHLTDVHARQIIYCLTKHEHITMPNCYCPFRHKCAFNEVHGWQNLGRRAFHRTDIGVDGRLYLTHINNEPVPHQVTKRRIDCIIADLSLGGAKLISPLNIPENSTFDLIFDELILSCTMRWKQQSEEKWIFGVMFSELSKDEKNVIMNIVIRHQVRMNRRNR